jgi:hypothetical protein
MGRLSGNACNAGRALLSPSRASTWKRVQTRDQAPLTHDGTRDTPADTYPTILRTPAPARPQARAGSTPTAVRRRIAPSTHRLRTGARRCLRAGKFQRCSYTKYSIRQVRRRPAQSLWGTSCLFLPLARCERPDPCGSDRRSGARSGTIVTSEPGALVRRLYCLVLRDFRPEGSREIQRDPERSRGIQRDPEDWIRAQSCFGPYLPPTAAREDEGSCRRSYVWR